MKNETFRQHLEELFGISGTSARPESRLIMGSRSCMSANPITLAGTLARTMERDRIEGELHSEDFIIEGLPRDMTLYTPKDLIEVAKRFYGEKGLSFNSLYVYGTKGFEEILNFSSDKRDLSVQFDLGFGFDGHKTWAYELWVTVDTIDFEKK